MKVLFLDVDGVLNCGFRWVSGNSDGLDRICLGYLCRVIDATNANIVLSSTWRLDDADLLSLMMVFDDLKISDKYIGKTQDFTTARNHGRHNEIKAWLAENSGVSRFAILDDDADAGVGLEGNFFQTKFAYGLTAPIADEIIRHFNS